MIPNILVNQSWQDKTDTQPDSTSDGNQSDRQHDQPTDYILTGGWIECEGMKDSKIEG